MFVPFWERIRTYVLIGNMGRIFRKKMRGFDAVSDRQKRQPGARERAPDCRFWLGIDSARIGADDRI